MNYIWKHLKTVCKHKAIVLKECFACGLVWQGITHDLSKFSPTEFVSSAKYFQGTRSPIEAEKAAVGYSAAWLHHKGRNPHHWEYWTDFGENGEVIANRIPRKYVIEMVCDWIGAGKAYGGDAWTQSEPLKYYINVRNGRHFHPDTEAELLKYLECIAYEGLDAFHKMVKMDGEVKSDE